MNKWKKLLCRNAILKASLSLSLLSCFILRIVASLTACPPCLFRDMAIALLRRIFMERRASKVPPDQRNLPATHLCPILIHKLISSPFCTCHFYLARSAVIRQGWRASDVCPPKMCLLSSALSIVRRCFSLVRYSTYRMSHKRRSKAV